MSHTTKSVMDLIQVCPTCKAGFIPENGEVCKCPPEPMFAEPLEVLADEADS